MANQPPHRTWRKRAPRAAAGERQGGKWPHRGRKGSRHRWAAEEMMEEGGRRLWVVQEFNNLIINFGELIPLLNLVEYLSIIPNLGG
jgi:hypothetical protein